MSTSPDQLLATPTEDQKGGSVVFDVPASEMKKSYKFCSIEKSSAGNFELYIIFATHFLCAITLWYQNTIYNHFR